jgi:Na+/phosphate symporter
MRRENRIKKIQKRIAELEKEIMYLTSIQRRVLTKASERKLDRLLDRRDRWEERLVLAELSA